MVIEIFKDKSSHYRVRLRARNGRILMSSEAYDTHYNAMRLAKRMSKKLNLLIENKEVRK